MRCLTEYTRSSAGIGKGDGDLGQLAKLASRPDAAQRWRRAKALVLDEVTHTDTAVATSAVAAAVAVAVGLYQHRFGEQLFGKPVECFAPASAAGLGPCYRS